MLSKISIFLIVTVFVSTTLFVSSALLGENSLITGEAIRGFCYDTDSGIDYEHYGELKLAKKVLKDKCLSERTLEENYCRSVVPKTLTYDCSEGTTCLGGACVTDEN